MKTQYRELTYTDGRGHHVKAAVEVDGARLDRYLEHLTEKARRRATGSASALGGAFRVRIVVDSAKSGGIHANSGSKNPASKEEYGTSCTSSHAG